MNTSETVQAAQRLLAEREALGLKKYGTTVDRTDLQAGDWLQHAIEEASDLLLYLIRLRDTINRKPTFAEDLAALRAATTELDRLARERLQQKAESQPAPAADPDQHWRREAKERQLNTSQEIQDRLDRIAVYPPAPAAAPEDAERAAYLARWKDAPEWADYRTVDGCGRVRWWPAGPLACEPRPEVQP